MKYYPVESNKSFIGREFERHKLEAIAESGESAIVVVYGRRRVGKTELLEQTFRQRNILKFEGLQDKPEVEQRAQVLRQLAHYVEDPLLTKLQLESWIDVFELLAKYLKKGVFTLYFEELQWLANYQNNFVSELKFVWDNQLRHNPNLIVVLCGSSPSFMINQVLKSKALYNRSQHELPLLPFSLEETRKFLPHRALREVMDAYLVVGGIPEYLKRLDDDSSVFISLCQQAFTQGGFFAHEHERIFTSSLSGNRYYQEIIEILSRRRFATREEIATSLNISSGGSLTQLLLDLEICGFISRYTPFNVEETSRVARYAISDAYLQFYFKFIKPHLHDINAGFYNKKPAEAINTEAYQKWLGFAFERWCRTQHPLIAEKLGFSAVRYRSGAFFKRGGQGASNANYQIDLVFDRADHVLTICEIKYLTTKASKRVMTEFERKLEAFSFPHEKKTLQKVLIASDGAEKSVAEAGYFDRILTLEDLF